MAKSSILRPLCLFILCSNALSAVVQTQQTVLAAVGEDVELSCQLSRNKGRQIIWKKNVCADAEAVAYYSKQFGQMINPGFTDKFQFKHTTLENCSIVIMNVTEQDEACYYCQFNTYPGGSFTGRTCLRVYELHEPVLDVTKVKNSTGQWLVSCSATGRPAPNVTLSVSQRDLSFSQRNTVSVTNANATVTVTTTAVLSGSHRNQSAQVGCAARVLSAPHKEVTGTIPNDDMRNSTTWIIVIVTLTVFTVAALIGVLLKRRCKKRDLGNKKQNRNPANQKTPT